MSRALRLAIVFALARPALVLAQPTVSVVGTSPSAGATLRVDDSFYVRIAYASDTPVRVWARPFLNGTPVRNAISNASASYVGQGEALGWFALRSAGAVDEIRVTADGGRGATTVVSYPVQLHWSATVSPAAEAPAWVAELRTSEAALIREAQAKQAAEPTSAGDVVLFAGFMLAVPASFLLALGLPVWGMWKWTGGWRLAAAACLALPLLAAANVVIGTSIDPTSHNLWPFEILAAAAPALVAFVLLAVARRVFR